MNYTLEDYRELAYEFAIRNVRVIELIKKPLTNKSVKELTKYGIDATAYYNSLEYNEEGFENTIRELDLNYYHFKDIKYTPYIYEHQDENFRGYKILTHPKRSIIYGDSYRENDIEALSRIEKLLGSYSETVGTRIESRKLKRCINKKVFDNYDTLKFGSDISVSEDINSSDKSTIRKDIELVEKWSEPSLYLQLLHKRCPDI